MRIGYSKTFLNIPRLSYRRLGKPLRMLQRCMAETFGTEELLSLTGLTPDDLRKAISLVEYSELELILRLEPAAGLNLAICPLRTGEAIGGARRFSAVL